MRINPLVYLCALLLSVSGAALAFDAAAPDATAGMSGGPPVTTPNSVPLPAPEQDPAARSAKSIECSQKADAQNLHGRPRKHFMHECKRGA
jgi:psiF repeat